MNYEPKAGESIEETSQAMVYMAAKNNCGVTAIFNVIHLAAGPDTTADDIQQYFWKEWRRRYEPSPTWSSMD